MSRLADSKLYTMYAANAPQNGENNPPYLPGFNENVTIHFEPGKTYRLRFINSGIFSMANVWVDGHMRIIELDGVESEETPKDVVPLSTAQRVSVLVTARSDMSKDWAINSPQSTDVYDQDLPELCLWEYIRIGYGTQPQEMGLTTKMDDFPFWNEMRWRSARSAKLLLCKLTPTGWSTLTSIPTRATKNYAVFGDTTFLAPQTPSLFTALSTGKQAFDPAAYGPGGNAFVANWLETVEISIRKEDTGQHPFHLHNYTFQIVQKIANFMTFGPVNESRVSPTQRGTVAVPTGGGQVILRLLAGSPGIWFLHCHIQVRFLLTSYSSSSYSDSRSFFFYSGTCNRVRLGFWSSLPTVVSNRPSCLLFSRNPALRSTCPVRVTPLVCSHWPTLVRCPANLPCSPWAGLVRLRVRLSDA